MNVTTFFIAYALEQLFGLGALQNKYYLLLLLLLLLSSNKSQMVVVAHRTGQIVDSSTAAVMLLHCAFFIRSRNKEDNLL